MKTDNHWANIPKPNGDKDVATHAMSLIIVGRLVSYTAKLVVLLWLTLSVMPWITSLFHIVYR
jgi:hypothetical protein